MSIESDIREHALEVFPEECVGFVSEGTYHRLSNVAPQPTLRYKLSIKDKMMLFRMGDKLTALVHSHPVLDNQPSNGDLNAQRSCQFPFWIIGTDGQTTTEINEVK